MSVEGAGLVETLQRKAARALPAAEVEPLGDWWLRHAPGCSWWIGTVLPYGDGPGTLESRVRRAEEFYAARGLATRFQLTPRAVPTGLDDLLAARGYRADSAVSLQTASAPAVRSSTAPAVRSSTAPAVRSSTVPAVRSPSPQGVSGPAAIAAVRIADRASDAWLATSLAVAGGDPEAERGVLERIGLPQAYAWIEGGSGPIAVGRAVLDDGWVGVFGMATLPAARGRGAARAILRGLAGWALERGAGRMYLQVEADNAAALRVYAAAGFGELAGFYYRSLPDPQPPGR